MRRLLLVRHAPTAATRAAAFPLDEPLDEAGRAGASVLVQRLPRQADVLCSPALRCVQTVEAAGLQATTEPALAECDFGAWSGRSLAEVHGQDPEAVGAWMTDPASAPHGGESLEAFARRVVGWLEAQARGDGVTVAITHGGVARAAVTYVLGAPLQAFWRLDIAPLSVTELHARDGHWTVTRVNAGMKKAAPAQEEGGLCCAS